MKVEAEVNGGVFQVNAPCSVEIAVSADRKLGPGDKLEFQFPHSWSLISGPTYTRNFQSANPAGEHYISVGVPSGDVKFKLEIKPRHLPCPSGPVRHGRHIIATIVRGGVAAGEKIYIRYQNTFAPYVTEAETVWLQVNGQTPELPPVLKVLPGPHEKFRILVPSGVGPGKEFKVLIVSLDRFDNASATKFVNEKLTLSDDSIVRKDISFTGSVRIPVKLANPGIYRFKMRDAASNAVRVAAGAHGPYWGDIHIHTKLSCDGQGTEPYKYARDVSGLDFAGVADHCETIGEEGYQTLRTWAEEAYAPGQFVTIPGDERNPRITGHHNLYFRDLDTFRRQQLLPGREQEKKQLQDWDPSTAMLVPHHTGINFKDLTGGETLGGVDWEACDDRGLRPLLEIYSHHGQSELYAPHHLLSYEFNRMRNRERRSNTSSPGPYYAQNYWMAGKRLGVIASSDEHSGQGGRPHGGITAVFGQSLTREGIFDALRAKHCYATTGERILIDFSVDGVKMGECGQRKRGGKLKIDLGIWGTALLLRIDLLRFRFGVDAYFRPILSVAPRPESMDYSRELEDELGGPCVYYVRITQEPLTWPDMAWTSPVWIEVDGV